MGGIIVRTFRVFVPGLLLTLRRPRPHRLPPASVSLGSIGFTENSNYWPENLPLMISSNF